jgi:hypothetical protein
MTRKKKTLPPEKKTIFPGVDIITDGRGFAQKPHLSVKYDVASAEHTKAFIRSMAAFEEGGFEGEIATYEKEAIKTLEDAGLPTNFGGSHAIPMEWDVSPPNTFEKLYFYFYRAFPEYGGMGLKELVQSRGYRRRESPEWYAAAIVESLSVIRAASRRQDTDWALRQAFRLGNYVSEASAFGFSKQTGKEGPPKRKQQKSPYPVLTRYLLRNYPDGPDGTDEHRFDMVPTDDELSLGRYKFYRDAGRIYAEEKVGPKNSGTWKPVGKPLKLSAFRKHMTKERKRISR